MRVPFSWLQTYCACDLSPARVAELLTMTGTKVDRCARVDGQDVFELEVTTNRPDCLSVIGVARELAMLTNQKLRPPAIESGRDVRVEKMPEVALEVRDEDGCPRYIARVLRNVRVGPSPEWLLARIRAVGLRPVNNVVDVTNFVLYETGQPLHAFDLEKLSGRQVVVRGAGRGERILVIENRWYTLGEEDLVIADSAQPVALAGIMGGCGSEITERTRTVLLESAVFDPLRIRRTSRRLGLSSDSSYRFERGVNPEGADWASRRAAELVGEVSGGEIVTQYIDRNALVPESRQVTLRYERLRKVLGIRFDPEQVLDIFQRLGLKVVASTPEGCRVEVPSYRRDLSEEIDLVEEVARIYGYERIPSTASFPLVLSDETPFESTLEESRRILRGAGYYEVLTWSFCQEPWWQTWSYLGDWGVLHVQDPSGERGPALRRSLIPGLLSAVRVNEAYSEKETQFAEISKVYYRDAGSGSPSELWLLGVIDYRGFRHLRGTVELLLERLGVKGALVFEAVPVPGFERSVSTLLKLDDATVGRAGMVARQELDRLGVRAAAAVAELDVEALLARKVPFGACAEFPRNPAVVRDLAVVLDERVTWAEVRKAIEAIGLQGLEKLEAFDEFQGAALPQGRKSLALRLTFREPRGGSLLKEQVEPEVRRVVDVLEKRFRAALRQ